IARAARQPAGRQRGDGADPSGNSRSKRVSSGMKPGIQAQFAAHISPPASGSEPGSANSVCTYQLRASSVNASHSGDVQSIQPIGLPGRRAATRAPSAANATIITAKLSEPDQVSSPLSGGGSRVPWSTKPNAVAVTAMTTVSP